MDYFLSYSTHCVPLGDQEKACPRKGISSLLQSLESTASLQFDTKNLQVFKDLLANSLFPLYFGPHYLNLKQWEKDEWDISAMAACTTVTSTNCCDLDRNSVIFFFFNIKFKSSDQKNLKEHCSDPCHIHFIHAFKLNVLFFFPTYSERNRRYMRKTISSENTLNHECFKRAVGRIDGRLSDEGQGQH